VRRKNLDEYLIDQAKRGQRTAFDLLVLRYQHKVIQIVLRYVKDPTEALDVMQDTFIRVYRGLDTFRGDSAFYTWLFRVAINTAKNHEAAKSRRPPDIDIDFFEAEKQLDMNKLNENATPEHYLYRDELQLKVTDTVDGMPEDLRAAIVLREMHGLSYEEISWILDCPVGTVRSRIYRARELLDAEIKPFMDH
jgi:RNA polymerase sigma-70 factor (ECF subfamily)